MTLADHTPDELFTTLQPAGADQVGSVSIDVTASWPSSDVTEAIANIVAIPSVSRVWATRPTGDRETGYVSVSSDDATAVRAIIKTIPIDPCKPTYFNLIPNS